MANSQVQSMEQKKVKFLVLLLEAGVLVFAGYLGKLGAPGFHLSGTDGLGIMLLAAGTGMAVFFSPCSFPLLLSHIGGIGGKGRNSESRSVVQIVRFAMGFSLGLCCFLLLAGGLVGWAGEGMRAVLPASGFVATVFRATMGALLVVFGLIQTNVLIVDFRILPRFTRGLRLAQAGLGANHPVAGSVVFGFGYALAGFG